MTITALGVLARDDRSRPGPEKSAGTVFDGVGVVPATVGGTAALAVAGLLLMAVAWIRYGLCPGRDVPQ